jgi:hypothetical protein
MAKKGAAAVEADLEYSADEMAAQVASLDAKLTKAEATEEAESLAKSLANVAEGAMDVAKEALGAKKRTKKAAAQDDALAKAAKAKAKDKDDDEDDEDDDDDEPGWMKKMTREEKGAGEMIYAYDRTDTGTHTGTNAGGEHKTVGKSQGQPTRLAGEDVIDVEQYLDASLREQKRLRKAVAAVADQQDTRLDALAKGLTEMFARLQTMETLLARQIQYTGVAAKALGVILDQQEQVLAQPSGSRFEQMRKSLPAIQAQLKAEGGSQVPYDKERASKAILKGVLTHDQHRIWKTTNMLPAGVSIN